MDEEFIFILDWGDWKTRLFFASCVNGRIKEDGFFETHSEGVLNGIPYGDNATKTLERLLLKVSLKYELKVQTIFCFLRAPSLKCYSVANENFIDEAPKKKRRSSKISKSKPLPEEVPQHMEWIGEDDSENLELKKAFAIHRDHRECLEKVFRKHDVFLEDFLIYTQADWGLPKSPLGKLVIAMNDESVTAFVKNKNTLTFYRDYPFSIRMMLARLNEVVRSLPEESPEQLFYLATRSPQRNILSWEEDSSLNIYLNDHLSIIQEIMGGHLESFVEALRKDLRSEKNKTGEVKEVYLVGELSEVFMHYIFLQDMLPLEFHVIVEKNHFQLNHPNTYSMRNLFAESLIKRKNARKVLNRRPKESPLRNLGRRLLGRSL